MKPNGLSGESEQPSEDQSSPAGFLALRAEMKFGREVEKRRVSVLVLRAAVWRENRDVTSLKEMGIERARVGRRAVTMMLVFILAVVVDVLSL